MRVTARRSRGRGRVLLSAALAALVALAVLPLSAAQAAVPGTWSVTGPSATLLSAGGDSPPAFSYAIDDRGPGGSGGGSPRRDWDFTTVAASSGTVTLPYHYSGFSAFCRAMAVLTVRVDGVDQPVSGLPSATPTGPVPGCQGNVNGPFDVRGTVTVDVLAGQTYGFHVWASNFDSNSQLSGTLRLEAAPVTAPYDDPAAVASNTSWPNALERAPGTVSGTIGAPGEARWFRLPVTPDSDVRAQLTGLTSDLDVALYGDIGQAFTEATTTTADVSRLTAEFAGDAYSPSVYSPSVYSPSVYSPSVYSPSVYSPSVYSPSVYSPSVYSPSVYSPSVYSPTLESPDQAFLDAFSGAQTRSLRSVSVRLGTADEEVVAATFASTGSFYVRVQGKGGATGPFTLALSRTGGACEGVVLSPHLDAASAALPAGTTAVVLTDTARLGLTETQADGFRASLGRLGTVVDAAQVPRLQRLNAQADGAASCPYAKNLVAQALRQVVAPGTSSVTSVTIAGDDSVVPFFRYPDTAGLAPESGYVPPVDGASASAASLGRDTVLGQDAYGAAVDVSIKGTDVPVPLLPVGRLVETPAEILTAVDAGLTRPVLPSSSSLVTGYDFLTDAADAVSAELGAGTGAAVDDLITEAGVPLTQTTVGGVPDRQHAWTATDLAAQLLDRRHDLVYLAGHFSGNSALAADERTSLLTSDLAARPLALQDSLVLSAGCHSGYNIVDREGLRGVTNGLDWAQEMARQQAVLVAGTGYQYGDTDFLAYGERLYLGLVRELRRPGDAPVAVGTALVDAKQEYLSSTPTMTGMDVKSVLQATLYGLPTRSVDLPNRVAAPPAAPVTGALPVDSGPGAQLALSVADTPVAPSLALQSKALVGLDGAALPLTASWLTGPDGVVTTPAAPALPLQVLPAAGPSGSVLRGVALRSADYTDRTGVTPLTGAPATERSGVHTSFSSPAFWPQTVARANQFGALASGDGTGTSLVLTPAQYRSDSPGSATATERAYQALGLSLFWSGRTDVDGAAGSAPPSLSGVRVVEQDGRVRVSVHATADPRAGLQQVWATYTAEAGSWHGAVRPLDLQQDATDSTLWTGTVDLPDDVPAASARFVLTAVSGVGLVGTDTAYGDGYVPQPATAAPERQAVTLTLTAPSSAVQGALAEVTASGAPAGAAVEVELGTSTAVAVAGPDGRATARLRVVDPPGTLPTRATYAGDATHLPAAVRGPGVAVRPPPSTLELTAGTGPLGPTGAVADVVLRSGGTGLADRPVTLSLTTDQGTVVRVGRTARDGALRVEAPLALGTRVSSLRADYAGDDRTAPTTGTVALDRTVTATLRVLSAPSSAVAGSAFAEPLVLEVREPGTDRVVVGASVRLAAPATGATATFPAEVHVTGATGRVSVPLTAGGSSGSYVLTASGLGLAPVQVPLSNTPRYVLGRFEAPLEDLSVKRSSRKLTAALPVKIGVQDQTGAALSPVLAARLGAGCRVQLRGYADGRATSTGPEVCLPYDAAADRFAAVVQPDQQGWTPGSWTLEVVVLDDRGGVLVRRRVVVELT